MNQEIAAIAMKALDGLSARATVTAENIANASSPGYRPFRVSFEDALANAAAQGSDAVRAVSLDATPAPAPGRGGAVRPDLELATQAATTLRYGAIVDALSRELQLNQIAIEGGR